MYGIKFFILIFTIIINHIACAENSPFDVLSNENRYKSNPADEFDVNEGEENEVENFKAKSGYNVFDVIPEIASNRGDFYNTAKIVALNKITAKSKEFSIPVNKSVYFGNIMISVQKC